jgi:outer membrane protein, heavy metal efflux system
MKSFLRKLSISLVSILSLTDTFCQEEISYITNPVTLSTYLASVLEGNLGYIAASFDVSIAEADLKASKVFPNPEISLSYSNNQEQQLQMGQSLEAGIGYPVNLGNPRKAGIVLARTHYQLSQLVLEAYFQNLRADAALSYYAALRNQRVHGLQIEIYDQLKRLSDADSIRLNTGEATGLDALQSSLEARSQLTEVVQSKAEMQNSLLNLLMLQGKKFTGTIDQPADDFPFIQRHFILSELVNSALKTRADLLVAFKNNEVSEKYLHLLKAERAFEFNLEAGYAFNSIVRNEIAPAPEHHGLSAGLSFPIKFSGVNRGEIHAAELALKQSRTKYDDAILEITSEVMKAYNYYVAQNRKVEYYNQGLIDDANRILQGRIYSYQHGESGLLEVLNAQRTYIELQVNHIEALFEYSVAVIELERASGIWDLTSL